MTLNAVIALILRFFSPNSSDFPAGYITVVEDRPIMLKSRPRAPFESAKLTNKSAITWKRCEMGLKLFINSSRTMLWALDWYQNLWA